MDDELTSADLRALRVFRAVADAGGFAGAERKLGVRQSTISVQISGLESRLGFRLCERGRGGFRLTDRGSTLLEAHEKLKGALTDFVATARDLSGSSVGRLRLGIVEHAFSDDALSIVDTLADFYKAAPEVRLEVIQDNHANLREAVLDRSIDMAIAISEDDDPGLDLEAIGHGTQRLYYGPAHPWWTEGAPDDLAALPKANWISRNAGVGIEAGFPPAKRNVIARATNPDAVIALMQAQPAVGYLPHHVAAPHVADGRLRLLGSSYEIPYRVCLLSRTDQKDSQAMTLLRQVLAKRLNGGIAPPPAAASDQVELAAQNV